MDGNLMNLKQWKCPEGHVIGVVKRVEVAAASGRKHHVSRLMLFRQAVNLDEDGKAEDVDVMAVVEGTTLDVRCSVCGKTRSWWLGEDAMERILEKPPPASATHVADMGDAR